MNLLYRADKGRSLNVMWHAYLAATPRNSAKNLSKNAATVGHAFLNARCYDSSRGQFLSEDPVHLAVGNGQQIKQLTGQDMQSYLSDLQQLNSYAYANGNPITKSDPSGKWGEISGTVIVPGRAFSAGIRLDTSGMDFFMSGGFREGAGAGVGIAWAPGQSLSHIREGSISINYEGADVLGGRLSQNIVTYSPDQKNVGNGTPSGAIMLGEGGGGSVQEEVSTPIFIWGQPNVRSDVSSLSSVKTYLSAGRSINASPSRSLSLLKSSYINTSNAISTTQTFATPNYTVVDRSGHLISGAAESK